MKDLTPAQRKRLEAKAEQIRKADARATTLRDEEAAMWAVALEAGVPMTMVGRASGVSDAAVRNRMKRGAGKPRR